LGERARFRRRLGLTRGGYAPVVPEPVRSEGGEVDFEQSVEDALASLPDLRDFMSNVAVVIEDEPPAGMPLLGL
jgi:hypothetical protein